MNSGPWLNVLSFACPYLQDGAVESLWPEAGAASFLNTNWSAMLMRDIQSTAIEADQGVTTLKTTFASRQQAASLIRALDLTPEEMEQVSGGGGDFTALDLSKFIHIPIGPFPGPISCMPIIDRGLDLGAIQAAGLK
jgi:hypothetical protein